MGRARWTLVLIWLARTSIPLAARKLFINQSFAVKGGVGYLRDSV
jgi:hypothetical protein